MLNYCDWTREGTHLDIGISVQEEAQTMDTRGQGWKTFTLQSHHQMCTAAYLHFGSGHLQACAGRLEIPVPIAGAPCRSLTTDSVPICILHHWTIEPHGHHPGIFSSDTLQTLMKGAKGSRFRYSLRLMPYDRRYPKSSWNSDWFTKGGPSTHCPEGV